MNFAKEGGREGCPVNRRFKPGKMDDESLQLDVHLFFFFGELRSARPVDSIQGDTR